MLGIMQTQTVCDTCRGEGTVIKNKCKHCGGEGIVKGEKQVEVELPAGLVEGYAYNFQGKGGAGRRGGVNGDLQILVHEKPHPELVRDGCDLVYNLLLTVPQAALGGAIEIPTLDGAVKLKIEPGTQPGKTLRLRGKGLPAVKGYGYGNGDILVNISVFVPKTLTRDERKAIEGLRDAENFKCDNETKTNFFDKFCSYFTQH
jgi:molecular chaperone DnaJ